MAAQIEIVAKKFVGLDSRNEKHFSAPTECQLRFNVSQNAFFSRRLTNFAYKAQIFWNSKRSHKELRDKEKSHEAFELCEQKWKSSKIRRQIRKKSILLFVSDKAKHGWASAVNLVVTAKPSAFLALAARRFTSHLIHSRSYQNTRNKRLKNIILPRFKAASAERWKVFTFISCFEQPKAARKHQREVIVVTSYSN